MIELEMFMLELIIKARLVNWSKEVWGWKSRGLLFKFLKIGRELGEDVVI